MRRPVRDCHSSTLFPELFYYLTKTYCYSRWMPETPQYLLGKNRRRDAERALRWLRGPHADLSAELEDMQKDVSIIFHDDTR